jgi:hypothetical protein
MVEREEGRQAATLRCSGGWWSVGDRARWTPRRHGHGGTRRGDAMTLARELVSFVNND